MSMLLIEGVVNDFTFAARLDGEHRPFSLQMYLPPREVCNFVNRITHTTEELFHTGRAPTLSNGHADNGTDGCRLGLTVPGRETVDDPTPGYPSPANSSFDLLDQLTMSENKDSPALHLFSGAMWMMRQITVIYL